MTEVLGRNSDPIPSCWPSLGLGNTAGAEILEGDVWSTKIAALLGASMIPPPTVAPSLGLGNLAGAGIREGDVWRAPKLQPALLRASGARKSSRS